jgi:hypothetical protein
MQAVELCTHVLSTDGPWQIKSVDVNEGGLRMGIHVGFNSASRLCLSRTHKKTCPNCSVKLTVNRASDAKIWRHTNLGPLQTTRMCRSPRGATLRLESLRDHEFMGWS